MTPVSISITMTDLTQLKATLEKCAQRIFDLHNNPDHGLSPLQVDRLIDAENFIDHTVAQLHELHELNEL